MVRAVSGSATAAHNQPTVPEAIMELLISPLRMTEELDTRCIS